MFFLLRFFLKTAHDIPEVEHHGAEKTEFNGDD